MLRKSISSGSSVLVLKKRFIVIFLRFWSLPSFVSFEGAPRFVVELEFEFESDSDADVVVVVEGGGGDTALRDDTLGPNDGPEISIALDDEKAL